MLDPTYSIRLEWDAEAQQWLGSSDDIHGLILAAPTLAGLLREAAEVAPQLMELNGQPCPAGSDE
jgi:hypothetical protein